ncbi:hypothetical protein OIU91_02770 [Streptomyces sp. NBC_01456]|uniref:hypothetical protein n=1 Tax=unclassified Streptomyces TaxID=2593676 RepID=UPI002E32B819|nr:MULTISPECIES: hypothetical protein [unclassified Streptomyces]
MQTQPECGTAAGLIGRGHELGFVCEELARLAAALASRQRVGQYRYHFPPRRRRGELVQRGAQVTDRGCRMSWCLGPAEFGQQRTLPRRRQFAQRAPEIGHRHLGVTASRGLARRAAQRAGDPRPAGGFGGEQMPGDLLQRAVLVV